MSGKTQNWMESEDVAALIMESAASSSSSRQAGKSLAEVALNSHLEGDLASNCGELEEVILT
jgi:hypothetical protein